MPDSRFSLCWFRRDLRLHDHAALYYALKSSDATHCVFVFDTTILDTLPFKSDRRVEFIWQAVRELSEALHAHGSALHVLHGDPRVIIPQLAVQLGAQTVYVNHDYEPEAIARDEAVRESLQSAGIGLLDFKDQVIFERDEVLTGGGTPFNVFTPYKNAWLKRLTDFHLRAYPTEKYFAALAKVPPLRLPSLAELGFQPTNLAQLKMPTGMSGAMRLFEDFQQRMARYHEQRDFPAVKGVSYLAPHLRFGTISIRSLAREAYYRGGQGAQTWLSELIWRDFYQMLLYHNPRVVGHAFKPQFEHLAFTNNVEWFTAWKAGQTGYPLVDAGMRQLAQTGFMHNRLRMVTASFLVKDLQIDWRWGEAWFAENLLDFDLAANNGGWQWAASTGCDAQPWFRIFNPVTQSKNFDPDGKFIRRYVPELAGCPARYLHAPWEMNADEQRRCGVVLGQDYPPPIVDHAVARELTLAMFKLA